MEQRATAIVLASCLCFLLLPSICLGATWYVPSATCPTIQSAVNLAGATDDIILTATNYSGPGNIDVDYLGKAITIRSQSGDPTQCTINCGGSAGSPHRAFKFVTGETASSVLEGVTIRDGYGPIEDISSFLVSAGGAIYCDYTSPTVTDCRFLYNTAADWGGAVMTVVSSATFTDCVFQDNTANYGGAVNDKWSYSVPNPPAFTRCSFSSNYAPSSGGAMEAGAVSLYECTFTGNWADWDGGAISGAAYAWDTAFTGNWASMGGALSLGGGSFTDCTFQSNWAPSLGGAVWTAPNGLTFDRCLFTDNASDAGGGIFATDGGGLLIDECTFWVNTGYSRGGAVCIDWLFDSAMDSCTVADNISPWGAGLWVGCYDLNMPFPVDNTIVAFNGPGEGIGGSAALPGYVIPTCCDVFGNIGGDYVGCIAAYAPPVNNNIWADPLFCYGASPQPYTLYNTSPCAAGNNPMCGRIGAWDVDCTVTLVQETSWGAIKVLYR